MEIWNQTIPDIDPNAVQNIRRRALVFKEGGTVPGPDVDEDVVPTMLTPGEEVINADSAEASRDLLKLINENPELAAEIQEYLMSMGVQNFNDGGTVAPSKKVVQDRLQKQLQRMAFVPDYQNKMMEDYASGKAALNMATITAQEAQKKGLSEMDFGPKPTVSKAKTDRPSTTPVPVPSMDEALPEVPEFLRRPSEASVSAETQSNQLKNPNTLSGWERMGLAPFGAMGGYIPYDKVSYDNEDQRDFMQQQIYGETGSPLNAGMLGTAADFIVKAPWRATKFAVVDPIRSWFESSSQNARTRQRQEFEAFMQSRGN